MRFWNKLSGVLRGRVYADAAAAAPLSKAAMWELLRTLPFYGNAGALHKEGVRANEALEHARARVAQAVEAHPDEIFFTASGTEANNLAIAGVLRPLLREHGELHAIVSAVEHASVLEPLRALEPEGLYLTLLPVDSEGLVSPKALAEAIQEETVFVSVQMVNSEIGTVQPVRELMKTVRHVRQNRIAPARALRAARPSHTLASSDSVLPLYFHCDASQAPLWLPLRAPALGVDLMTLDAQKIMGPKGVGALFAKRGTSVEPIIHGGSQEHGLRGGTPNVPLVAAFAVALEEAQKNVESRAGHVASVRDYLFEEIKKRIPEAVLNGPIFTHRVANNLNISIPKLEGEVAVIALDAKGVSASTRSACSTGEEALSHVLQAIGISNEQALFALRLTLLPDATRAQARRIARALAAVAERYKTIV